MKFSFMSYQTLLRLSKASTVHVHDFMNLSKDRKQFSSNENGINGPDFDLSSYNGTKSFTTTKRKYTTFKTDNIWTSLSNHVRSS